MEYTVRTEVGLSETGRSVVVVVEDSNKKTITLRSNCVAGNVNLTISQLIRESFDRFFEKE